MGRVRKKLEAKREVSGFSAIFFHPISQRTARIPLGADWGTALPALNDLNRIFLDPAAWNEPPRDIDRDIRAHWLKHCGAREVKTEPLSSDVQELIAKLAIANSAIARLEKELADSSAELIVTRKTLEQLQGRKIHVGPWPSLERAKEEWIARYKGRDGRHTKNVGWMLSAFVTAFKADTRIDRLEGREKDIEAWLRGLDCKAGVRSQYRRYVLKMLAESGLAIDRKLVPAPKKHEIRRDRKRIEWLDIDQAKAVAAALPEYYADCWRVQVALGLRPDELITLKKSDLRGNKLTLSPLNHLTLKTGPRTISVPEKTLDLLKARLKQNPVVFPQPVTIKQSKSGGPWASERYFELRYRTELQKVEGMPFTLDCRTGRRTCGSILIREGHSIEEVAALLGDRIETVKEHYAAILPSEVKLVATSF